MAKKKRARKKNMYFRKEHQEAIVQYVRTDDNEEKQRLYVELIDPVFDELIKKIVFTYKFYNVSNHEDMQRECKAYLMTVLSKFDPERGSRAFAYFTVVVKNWFIAALKKQSKRLQREVDYTEIPKGYEEENLITRNEFEEINERCEFWDSFVTEMEYWETNYGKDTPEAKVHRAILTLFQNAEKLQVFNRPAIYYYIEQLTGLDTHIISVILKKMAVEYLEFKRDWDEGLI